ncbi:MAG TPA: hypothetical protein VMT81_00820 [Candidatus Paceibacterota bacterium]|nr:hypothetical protein [Candidatus Paceibacterota bacterium]
MKKVTLFFDKTVRDAMKKPGWNMDAAYQAALNHFAKIIAFGSNPRISFGNCYEPFGKYTCGCHAESTDLRRAFTQAHRIEACLTRRWNFNSLTLEFRTYRSGETVPAFKQEFAFAQNGSITSAVAGGGF